MRNSWIEPSASGAARARVDQTVLLDEREALEAAGDEGDLEVVAAARAVEDVDRGAREGVLEQPTDRLDHHGR